MPAKHREKFDENIQRIIAITDIAKKLIEAYDNNEKVNVTKVRLFRIANLIENLR